MKRLSLVLALVVATGVGTAVAQANKGHGQHVGKGHGTVRGVVTAVDTSGGSITLMNRKSCESKTIDVTEDTNVRVNGKAGTLADIKGGYVAKVKLANDGSAKKVKAWASRLFHGTVKELGTNTVTLKLRHSCEEPIVTVTSDTRIQVNGKEGTLADLKEGYRAYVKVGKDGNARWIKARAPKS